MTSAALPFRAVPRHHLTASEATGPDPRPVRTPVFIHDAVIPWRGETLLLDLLRRDAERFLADED